MAVIKKFGENLTQNLTSFQTLIVDDTPNSQYFKITEFKDTFTGGKNGFLIEGSEHLKESTEIKIQILDVEGNPIYYEPGNGVPEYYEGTSKLVAVYVYEDTPIGTAKITILGELKTYIEEGGVVRDVPEEWKNVYNVKWEKTFQVNRLLSNEDKVRFYRRPAVSINEIVKPIFNNVTTTVTQTGSLSGIAQFPQINQSITNFTLPTSYLLSIEDSTNWTGSIIGTTISVPTLGYTSTVDSVINNKDLLVITPYTVNGLVSNFTDEGYTASFNYVEGVNNLKTALTGSFAKIVLSDLTTFVGDVARVKIFRKSQSDLADYQFIQEIRLESNEILRDLESQIKNEEFYGLFDNTNFKNYWATSSNNITTTFNQNYLYNSVKLNSSNTNYFYTTASLGVTDGIEYTLTFNTRVGNGAVDGNNYIRAFLSGSKVTSVNGSPKTIQVEKNIVTATSDNSLLQKSQVTANFKAEESNNTKLYFEVKGNDWYISDVSLRASQETAYSPDEITFIQSVPRSLPEETFDYRFEFYDINNNYIPVLVEASKTFNGGNLQKIQKGLVFTPRSLQFQFDSGSQPVPPTVVGFAVTKNLLTGSITYTSQSFDFDGNELFGDNYTSSITVGGGFPGLLDDITSDAPTMTVQHFTGSRTDKIVQLVKITGEVEGFTDTVIFSRVLDGFGGVNYVIRPYRGTQIRNSSTSSLEIQAVRIDGINDIELSSLTKPEKGWPDTQLHVISRSLEGNEKFVNLAFASSSRYISGLTTGSLGSGQINYNATFNRDSIDVRRTVYMISSASAASGPAFQTSGSVLASIILEDLQDGLDTPVVIFNADTFNIDPRTERTFRPQFAFATASFYKRGSTDLITASFQVFPSMSINQDWTPEYWFYYTTQSVDPTISIVAIDESRRTIPAGALNSVVRSPLSQSKNITVKFTYTEPYTSPSLDTASISVDKTFTIVPQGTPGDETIVFEVNPINVTLAANSRGIVNDYKPSITDIRLKQGARYLAFSSSAASHPFFSHGQFYIASSSIIERNVKAGNIHFTSSFGTQYTASLIVSQSSNLTDLTGSVTYPLVIHPYFTSSIYTASVVVNYTKVLDGPPPIQIVISPTSVAIPSNEVGFVSSYTNANTTIKVKEGDDFLRFTTQSTAPGTWRINKIETSGSLNVWNIRTGSLSSSSLDTATINFNRFDYPFVSASAIYTIQVYPYALGAGHQYTSSIFERTQTFTKNVSVPNARTVELKANPYTINYSRDGYRISPEGDVELKATAQNYTGSTWFTLFFVDTDGSETLYDGPYYEGVSEYTFIVPGTDAAGPGENKTWRVKLTDGNPYTSSILNPYRAEGQLTIAGIKAGADAYKVSADNTNTSITAELYSTNLSGTAIKLPTFKGTTPLVNVTSGTYPSPQPTDYDYLNNLIGILGYSSASIYSKSSWITLSSNRVLTTPATMPDITGWQKPAINKSGEIVYKIEFEGYSTNVGTSPSTRQTEFVTQSFAVQFTEPAPYDVKLTRENAAAVYKVSGEISLTNTSTQVLANRGPYALVNQPAGFTGAQTDAYGSSSYQQQYRVQISAVSGHLTLDNGNLTVGSYLSGTPTANMPGVTAWSSPETNKTGIIVYEINCEGRQTFYKTQSLSVQFEGAVGPGIVMRGEWDSATDYIGQVETTNNRRDAVTYLATPDTVKYYAAISGSGPATYDQNGVLVNYHAPTPSGNNAWWEYLGDQEFFVAAKIAIFEESYVKNTINVGTKNGTGAFANIVLAGGRTDPYIAIGQNATVGTAGTSGTSINPGGSVIGYDRPGIFLGIYEQGAAGTTGRFSIKDTTGTRYIKWDGTDLGMSGKLSAGSMELGTGVNSSAGNGLFLNGNNYWYDTGTAFKVGGASNYIQWNGSELLLKGTLRQTTGGANEGRVLGPWVSGYAYLANDIVSNAGRTWYALSDHTSAAATEPYVGASYTSYWALAADAGTSGTAGSGGSSGTAGTAGGPGPGITYVGECSLLAGSFVWVSNATARMATKDGSGNYYLTKAAADNQTKTTTGCPPNATYFEAISSFAAVATDILLAQDASIYRGLVLGTLGGNNGFIRSANASGLTTGTQPGFYLQQDGKFRFGSNPGGSGTYIYFDGTTFTIKGKLITDENSTLGNWKVVGSTLQDNNGRMKLDPDTPALEILDGGDKLVDIRYGNLSDPASSGTVTWNGGNVTLPYWDGYSSVQLNNSVAISGQKYYSSGTLLSVPTTGNYSIASPSYGGSGYISIAWEDANMDFNGYVAGYVSFELHSVSSNPDGTTALWLGPSISTFDFYSAGATGTAAFNSYPFSVYLDSSVTYYLYTVVEFIGGVYSGDMELYGTVEPGSITLNLTLNQTEITDQGIQALSDNSNYFRVDRSQYAYRPYVTVKSNQTSTSNPALQLENTGVGGLALKVVDGDTSFNNNNIDMGTGITTWQSSNGNYGRLTQTTQGGQTFPTVYLQNLYSAGGGTIRGLEISLSNWTIGRDTSSRRHKYGIVNWEPENLLDKIMNVPIRNYYWKVDKDLENPVKQTGVIAEEIVDAGFEDWVDYDWFPDPENPDAPKQWLTSGIDKQGLVFILWKAVQELTQKVKDLESKLNK